MGVEPTHPPWQGSRLPLHHGRLIGCRVVKDRERRDVPRAPGGNRTLVTALRVRCLAAGPPVLIRCGQPIASLSLNGCPKPKLDVDKSAEVGPEGLEPSPAWVRTRDAAANTSIPFVCLQSARWESNPRLTSYKDAALTAELRAIDQ